MSLGFKCLGGFGIHGLFAPITFSSKLSCFLLWAFILFMVFVLCFSCLVSSCFKGQHCFPHVFETTTKCEKTSVIDFKTCISIYWKCEKTSAIDFKTCASIWCCLVVSFGTICMINRKPTKLKDSISMKSTFLKW